MAAEAARVLDFPEDYVYGSAVPAVEIFEGPAYAPPETAQSGEKAAAEVRPSATVYTASGVSLFAVFGSVFAAVLMVFVMLAQISFNEMTGEIVRLGAQLSQLNEQEKRLEIAFESVVDMKEVEMYARDVLGMSKPDPSQGAIIQSVLPDRVEIIGDDGARDTLRGLGAFISSLTEYFKRSG